MGNLLKFVGLIKNLDVYNARSVYGEYYYQIYGEKLPPVTLDYRFPNGILDINDPRIVQELYTTFNKVFDKSDTTHMQMMPLTGDSIIFSKSNEQQALKRKHLSASLYKEKLHEMLKMIISITNERV